MKRLPPISRTCSRAISRRGENGFTLLETLVALTIFSLSVVVLFSVFSGTLDRARDDRLAAEARVLAQRLVVEAELSGTAHDSHGIDNSGLSWMLHIAPSNPSALETQQTAQSITATVRWTSAGATRGLTLSTLSLVPVKSREPS